MNFNEFKLRIESMDDCDRAKAPATQETLVKIEKTLTIKFGPLLREYLLAYGYLGRRAVELCGVNEVQKELSDLVMTSKNLYEYAPQCRGFVVIDTIMDGQRVLCDQNDRVYLEPIGEKLRPITLDQNVLDYMVGRLMKA